MDSPLIDVAELARLIAAETRPSLLDVRWDLGSGPQRADYEAGHIPGAVFVDLDRHLAAPPGRTGRHPLPTRGSFGAAMRAAGVDSDRPVVVYDAATGMAAARAWWLLRYFGHADVRLLDGGLAAWQAADRDLTTGEEWPAVGDFAARPGGMPVLDADSAAELARTGVLLDARAPERFRGESEPIDPVAGHIPRARNRPTTLNLRDDGRFDAGAALRRAFADLGVTPPTSVGVYCGSGVTAAHEIAALQLAGITAALYPGSWSEWITDPARPVATGP